MITKTQAEEKHLDKFVGLSGFPCGTYEVCL